MPTYKDNALNRCHNRVGKEYGMKGKAKKTAPRKRRILPEIPKEKVKVQTRGQKTSAYKAQLSKMPKAVQKVKDTKYKAQLSKMPKAVQKVKDTAYKEQLAKMPKAVKKANNAKAKVRFLKRKK